METLPQEFVIFDTEFTAWEGSQERNWSGENEYREVIQIGAVKIRDLREVNSFLVYVKPERNPTLSEYIIELTGITQQDIETQGVPYPVAQSEFHAWCGPLQIGSFGTDAEVLLRNAELTGIPFPFRNDAFFNIREVLEEHGVDTTGYMSSTIPRAFGIEPPPDGHNALNDARSILLALSEARIQGVL
ncbi:MAG: 3'-5' exonuclease [Candidatus Paceibacterota bacterium]